MYFQNKWVYKSDVEGRGRGTDGLPLREDHIRIAARVPLSNQGVDIHVLLYLFQFILLFLSDFMICIFSIFTVNSGNPTQFLSKWGGQLILTSGWLPVNFRLIYGEFHKLSHTGVLFRHVWLSMLFVSFGHFWVLRNNRCPMHHKTSHDNIVCNN